LNNDPEMRAATIARPRQSISIALRMTIWYALSTFALIFVTTGLLYWVLVGTLYDEDFRDMADSLNNGRMLMGTSVPSGSRQAPDIRPPWAMPHQPEIYLRLLDRNARILVETRGMTDELLPPSKTDLAKIPVPDGRKQEIVSRTGKPFLALTVRVTGRSPTEPAQFLQVALDREHDRYLLARYRERLWWILGVSLVLSSLVGYLIARSGMRPIERIGQTAERIRSTTLHERINPAGLPAELSGLAGTFNSMLDRLQESFQRISQFSDDVAHELRTPVNNLRGEIEVALSKSRTGEDYRDTLGSCLEECTRISRLIQSLLFLARTESTSEPLQGEHIDVGKELATVLEFYEAAAAEAGVILRALASDGLSAQVDRTLFQQAIGNLVSNAITHTKSGGSVEIAARADNGLLIVTVTDSGSGIAAEHLPHVFDRFYRADPARTNSGQNVGLGLAVVKGIVGRHGGHVEIDSEIGRGTQVRLILPSRS
jgi:two-component system heavy metal sensor histidine kinase CusS